MKRLLVLFIIILVAGGVAARVLMDESGYMLVIYGPWELETSLGFAVLVLTLVLLAVVVLTLVLAGLWRLVSPWALRERLSGPVARRRLERGFQALVKARYKRAQKLFRAAARGNWPLPAWLGAARAATVAGRADDARTSLENARECEGGRLPADLAMARLDLADGALAQARTRLSDLSEDHASHPERLELLCEVLERQQDWPALRALLPRLSNARQPSLVQLQRRLWLALLLGTGEHERDTGERLEALRALWKDIPADLQQDPALLARYTGYLAQSGGGTEAWRLVRKALEQQWDDRLPPVLEAIDDVPAEKLLSHLETWLETRAGNGALLMTAGRVALRGQLWGKARNFFRAALSSNSASTARLELARLLEALGETAEARGYRDQAYAEAVGALPSLPLPAAEETE